MNFSLVINFVVLFWLWNETFPQNMFEIKFFFLEPEEAIFNVNGTDRELTMCESRTP